MKKIFGDMVLKLAEQDDRVVLLLCDVTFPRSDEFKEKYPDRYYNFGLTECATVGISAGMASRGLKPIMYSIAPFVLERALEFIKIDIDINNLPVILVGYDYGPYYGQTHASINAKETIEMFRNIRGYFPETTGQVEYSMKSAHGRTGPSFILLKKENA